MQSVRYANPWAVVALAIGVLAADQWTKAAAIEALASPSHPMVVTADGAATAATLFAGRGVGEAELTAAISKRHLWIYVPADNLRSDLPLGDAKVPSQLVALQGTGYPPPRRVRVHRGDKAKTLGEMLARELRVDAENIGQLMKNTVFSARQPVRARSDVPAAGHLAVLMVREKVWIPGFMKMVYAENPGAAWGFMSTSNPTLRQLFFSAIALVAAVAMLFAIWTGWMGSAPGTWALGAVLGGAVGNLIDRVRYQVVVDFVLNFVGEHRWPVYNVADIGISVGVGVILIALFLQPRPQEETTHEPV